MIFTHMTTNPTCVYIHTYVCVQVLVASASDDKTIHLWNPENGDIKMCLEGHTSPVMKLTVVDMIPVSSSKQPSLIYLSITPN